MRGFTLSAAAAVVLAAPLLLCAHAARAAQPGGAVAGRVTDPAGAVVVGASLILRDAAGRERRTASDAEGRYAFAGLAPGAYTLRVEARGFQPFEAAGVRVVAGRRRELDVRLAVGLERQEVTVGAESPLGVEPGDNRSALRFDEADLDALPEDPADLAAALQSLAGAPVIARNYGEGPGYFVFNLGVSRTFAFGRAAAVSGGGGQAAGAGGDGRFRVTPGLRFTNLFNRVNLDTPVGNLGSPLFGRSVATAGGFGAGSVGNPAAGNRRVEAQIRVEF